LRFSARALSKKVSQKGEAPLIRRIGFDADAGLVHVEEHETDALVLGTAVVRADQAEDPVGLVGVGRPHLLAVDRVIVAAIFGAGLERGEIGPGIRLGIALAPADLTAADRWQVLALLLLAAELEQCRAEHGNAEGVEGAAGTDARHFFSQHTHLVRIETAAAVLPRPVRHGPPPLRHALAPDHLVRVLDLGLAPPHVDVFETRDRCTHGFGTVVFEPAAGFLPENIEIAQGRYSVLSVESGK
jgi:hypothetical protein